MTWSDLSAGDQAEITSYGMAPPNSLESAWIGNLSPGAYTVHLSGVGGGTGIGMIETFDTQSTTSPRLFNTSTRCEVGTGAAVATAGLIVSGDKPRQVYIRALGPTLSSFGVPGALADTKLTLRNSTGSILASNDNWRDYDGTSSALELRLARTGYPPINALESAIVMRLSPGAYTVTLEGVGGATGVGLIEINEY